MNDERWQDIPGLDGRYQVSSVGRVRSVNPSYNKAAWYERTGGIMHIRKNRYGYRADNRLENIRWDTASGNAADRRKHGTQLEGEDHPSSKLTAIQVRVIRSSPESESVLGLAFGVTASQIGGIKRGYTWKKSA